jgi:hypothetical protein
MCPVMQEIGNWNRTQRNDTAPEMIKLPTFHPADKRRHIVATPFSAPETDVESRSARERSVTTDDSVCHLSD